VVTAFAQKAARNGRKSWDWLRSNFRSESGVPVISQRYSILPPLLSVEMNSRHCEQMEIFNFWMVNF
jgi:hypothetical protein